MFTAQRMAENHLKYYQNLCMKFELMSSQHKYVLLNIPFLLYLQLNKYSYVRV